MFNPGQTYDNGSFFPFRQMLLVEFVSDAQTWPPGDGLQVMWVQPESSRQNTQEDLYHAQLNHRCPDMLRPYMQSACN